MVRTISRTNEVERRELTLHYYDADERSILEKVVLVIVRRKAPPLKVKRGVFARLEKSILSGE